MGQTPIPLSIQHQMLRDGSVSYSGGYNIGLNGVTDQLLVITKQAKIKRGGVGASSGKIGKAWVMGCLDGLADGGHEDLLSDNQMERAHIWLDSEPD